MEDIRGIRKQKTNSLFDHALSFSPHPAASTSKLKYSLQHLNHYLTTFRNPKSLAYFACIFGFNCRASNKCANISVNYACGCNYMLVIIIKDLLFTLFPNGTKIFQFLYENNHVLALLYN
jgi:hypothetical protein